MSGSIAVRPIEANLIHDKDIFSKMDPYCIVHLGQYNVKGQVCKSGGRHPQWGDTITVQRNFEKIMLIEIKDKDRFSADDAVGVCHIDLSSLPPNTPVRQWYPLQRWHSNAGEILIELTFNQQQQQFGGQMGMQTNLYDPFQVSPYLSTHVQTSMGPAVGYSKPSYPPSYFQQQQPIMQGGFQQQPIMQGGFQQQQPIMQGGFQQQQPVYQQQPIMQGGFQQQPMMQGGFQQQQPVYQQQPMMQGGFQQQQPMMGGIQQPVYQQQPMMQGGIQQQPVYQQQQQQPYGQQGYMQPRQF